MAAFRCLVLVIMTAYIAMAHSVYAQDVGRAPLLVSGKESAPASQIREKTDLFDDGAVMSRSAYTTDNRLVGRISYYHDGGVRKEERFDRDGNKIEEVNFDSKGKLEDNFDGWAAKRWMYKDGTMRAESTYGEDGRLTERKIYNDVGELVDRQYVGDASAIDDTEEFNRGSVVTHETDSFYDKYGHKTGSMTTHVDDPEDWFGDGLYF